MPLGPLGKPATFAERLKGFFLGLVAGSVLFWTLILVNVCQMLSVLLIPFSRRAFRKINRFFANFFWSMCDTYIRKIEKVDIRFCGDDPPPKEKAILLPNHQEMADIPVLFSLGRDKGRLGDIKWFVKDIFKYVPGAGWGMLFLNCLFIKRNWTDDKNLIDNTFRKIINENIPVWVLTFAEGTRIRPKKLEQSKKYAQKNGMTPTDHVLIPRSKGFVATVQALRNHVDAVYDVTIGYSDGVPTLWQLTKNEVRIVHLHVQRIPMKDMPETDEALHQWLVDQFVKKDQQLDHFYKTGSFAENKP